MAGARNLIKAMTEDQLQASILDYARWRGWRAVHIRKVRLANGRVITPYSGDPGLPDLILARRGVVLLVELKSATNYHMQPGQAEWLAASNGHLWRPKDWLDGTISALLD